MERAGEEEWIYYSSAILLLGGEVAFLLEKRGDSTSG